MDKNDFSSLSSKVKKLLPSMNNINNHLNNFSKSNEDLDLKKIDNELNEIKKILDLNTIEEKKPSQIPRDTLINSIDDKTQL